VSIKYRPDIDGLRAIAVLSVLAFHLGVVGLPGGFVGVDIFFVISGYLISKIIFGEIATGEFSLLGFYERRARRILPAFFAVSFLTGLACYALFFPSELVDFSKSLLASTFFLANVFFFETSNYFSPAADRIPLLHYWTLGVEEQFYLCFPLLIIAGTRFFPNRLKAAILVCLLTSFAASAVMTHDHPTMTFYLLPFRAFELLIGSLLALPSIGVPRSPHIGRFATIAGLCAIFTSILSFNQNMGFPGFAAALPCLGTALTIWGGTNVKTAPSRLLGALPLRALGKISYSLYLVHWPVIVFGTQLFPHIDPNARKLLFFAVSIAGAILLYFLVERPVRFNMVLSRAQIFVSSAAILLLTSGIALSTTMEKGYPARFDAQSSRMLAFLQYNWRAPYRGGTCFLDPDQTYRDFPVSLCFPKADAKRIVLWGDSTAADLYPGLVSDLNPHNYALAQATASGCPPILGFDANARPNCKSFNESVFQQIISYKPSLVILSSTWGVDVVGRTLLKDTLARLKSLDIDAVVIGPKPFYEEAVPIILANRLKQNDHGIRSENELDPSIAYMDQAMDVALRQENVPYISILHALCRQDGCLLETSDGSPLEWDVLHFTAQGSKTVADRITPLLLAELRARSGL
jgi:peptidoglycan/LPS O-acetylase OafA/YrhL